MPIKPWEPDPYVYQRAVVAKGYGASECPEDRIELALALAECLECDEAQNILELAHRRWPADSEIKCWLAYVLAEEISGDEARRRAVSLLVDAARKCSHDLLKRAATTYAVSIAVQLGDRPIDEAIQQLRPLTTQGDLPCADEWLARLLLKHNRDQEAKPYVERLLAAPPYRGSCATLREHLFATVFLGYRSSAAFLQSEFGWLVQPREDAPPSSPQGRGVRPQA